MKLFEHPDLEQAIIHSQEFENCLSELSGSLACHRYLLN